MQVCACSCFPQVAHPEMEQWDPTDGGCTWGGRRLPPAVATAALPGNTDFFTEAALKMEELLKMPPEKAPYPGDNKHSNRILRTCFVCTCIRIWQECINFSFKFLISKPFHLPNSPRAWFSRPFPAPEPVVAWGRATQEDCVAASSTVLFQSLHYPDFDNRICTAKGWKIKYQTRENARLKGTGRVKQHNFTLHGLMWCITGNSILIINFRSDWLFSKHSYCSQGFN